MLNKIMDYATNFKLSDIHIHSDEPIALRINGSIDIQKQDVTSRQEVESFVDSILNDEQKCRFKTQKDCDLSIANDNLRFRVNVYNTMKGPAIVIRKIETHVPSIETLCLPPAVMKATREHNGLVLVTGPTGSGKSTTLAAMIDSINQERKGNIITIEDPIEFVHARKSAIISQREVGKDAATFGSALRAALREDPDVILLGEMRDLETISLALTAAETGHLVFGTLHTNGAPNTINRILDVFPPAQQGQARAQLSQSLRLVVTQQLIKRIDIESRVAAFEVMINNVAIANLIRENKVFQIDQVMQTAKGQGMIRMEDSIKELVAKGMIASDAE